MNPGRRFDMSVYDTAVDSRGTNASRKATNEGALSIREISLCSHLLATFEQMESLRFFRQFDMPCRRHHDATNDYSVLRRLDNR